LIPHTLCQIIEPAVRELMSGVFLLVHGFASLAFGSGFACSAAEAFTKAYLKEIHLGCPQCRTTAYSFVQIVTLIMAASLILTMLPNEIAGYLETSSCVQSCGRF
jgi:hypothetical protein